MSTATGTDRAEYRQLIGGAWVDASDGATFEDLNPYTGEVVAEVAAGTREDARRAIDAAAGAFPAWSQTPPAERQRVFLGAADILERRRDEVIDLLARETGCGLGFGMFQMGFVPGLFRQAAGLAYLPIGQVIPSDAPGTFAIGLRRPVGVVGAIAPWNAALILSARSIAAPIVLGNTVVAKPSEWSPFVGGLLWGEVFQEAGLPDGVLNVVTHAPGRAAPIGEELVENPYVRRINLTGSTATGRWLAEAAGRNLKRVVLELGGFNPLIVLADAELEFAVNAATFGAFLHQGQICMSTRRILVEWPIAEEFLGRLAEKTATLKVGDPTEPDTIIGPLITDVPPDSDLATLETFGPVAAVEIVDTVDDAVRRANETVYGLSAGVITGDPDRGLALAERLQSGIVHINEQTVGDEPQMPFGGVKDSGWGRFGGTAAVDEFTELKWVTVQSGTHPYPF